MFSLVCSSVLRPALVENRNDTKSGVCLLTYSRGIGTVVISCIVRDRVMPAVNFVIFFYLILCVSVCDKTRGGKAACLRKEMKRKARVTWVMGLFTTMSLIFVVLCVLLVRKSMPAERSFTHELLFGYNMYVCV